MPDEPTIAAAMTRALELAESGLGTTSPNPSVGCVVLDPSGTVVGQGRTAPAGGPHAEVVALAAAGGAARGGTAVVTLEPCAHTGRTGPCTRALLDAGVAEVVYALPDPNPPAAGGAGVLAAAGVRVRRGPGAAQAAALLRPWREALRTGRPHVTCKYAATLDGRAAAADGSSQWITGAAARADAHRMRGQHDALVVGIGTVLADDPALTVRGVPEPRTPVRVVLDGAGRTPSDARIWSGSAPTRVVTGPASRDLPAVLADLHRDGVRSVWVEGGPTLAGAFYDAGLVDRVIAYLAPALLGRGPVALQAARRGADIADAERLEFTDVTRVGDDLRVTAVAQGTSKGWC